MLVLTSPEIVDLGIIPPRFSMASGQNTSPPLAWTGAPAGTQTFALTLIDPDVPWGSFGLPKPGFLAGDLFVHWVLYDIPGSAASLAEGISPKGKLPAGVKQIENSAREFGEKSPFYQFRTGYMGMAPPAGDKAHGYIFTLLALGAPELALSPRQGYLDFLNAVKGKIIAKSSLTGYFGVKGEG